MTNGKPLCGRQIPHAEAGCWADLYSLFFAIRAVKSCRQPSPPPHSTVVGSEGHRCEQRQGSCYQSGLRKVTAIWAQASSTNPTEFFFFKSSKRAFRLSLSLRPWTWLWLSLFQGRFKGTYSRHACACHSRTCVVLTRNTAPVVLPVRSQPPVRQTRQGTHESLTVIN